MEKRRRVGLWLFGLFLFLHGFAHIPGILGAWRLKTYDDISHQPNSILPDASDTAIALLGIFWLVAAVSFVVTGAGIILRGDWWPPVASLATCSSLLMTILWHEDAIVGLVINIGLAVVFIGAFVWSNWGPAKWSPLKQLTHTSA